MHYEHTDVGYNYRMSNLLAALGRAQLSRLDEMIDQRRALRDAYKDLFAEVEGAEVFGADDDRYDNAWLTSIVIDEAKAGWAPRQLAEKLALANIESRPLWKPMHLQPVFAGARGLITGTSERLFKTALTLPSGSALTSDQHEARRVRTISGFLGVN